jgi:propanol-preferring alcohol dehydrogenase
MGLKVIAVDVNDSILAVAKAANVEYTLNSRTTSDCAEQVQNITQGGAAAVLVFTAVKAGYDFAPKVLRIGGIIVCVGCPPVEVSFNAMEISLGKFQIRGANNSATPSRLKECAEFTARHGIQSPSKFFALDQIGEMIELMENGMMGGLRLVVKF